MNKLKKLKNNNQISHESEILISLIDNMINNNPDETKKYDLMDNVLKNIARIFAYNILNEWFCCDCNYHNRIITIFNKKIKPNEMQKCMVCGCDKTTSIMKTLKDRSISKLFADKTEEQNIKCTSNVYIKLCESYQRFFIFIKNYSG
eukprot:193274_1